MTKEALKTVLVTGASSGIGKETAKALIAKGYKVFAAARRLEKMADLESLGGFPIKLDVTNEQDLSACVNHINDQHGGVDILVNNAGFGLYGSVEETSLDDVRRQFDVNFFAMARLTQLVLPHMRANKSGKIINIGSVVGRCPSPLGAWYAASKFAIEGWSDALRFEVSQFGIDVVIIEPGAIETEFYDVFLDDMLARSGHGPYSDIASAMANWTRKLDQQGGSSPPSVVSKAILHAINARKPKTRYAIGKLSKQMIFVRSVVSDRLYDAIVRRMVR